ncbi:MAG TPA: CHRD domain-containing protein [Chitinophagaceae bacterium]
MKTRLFSRGMFVALLASASLLFASCDKNDDDNDNVMYNVSGNASGSQEVPSVTTGATGTLTGTYNRNTNVLQYSIAWTGLSGNVSVAHFHGPADVGVSASPLIDLSVTTNGTSGTIVGSTTLSEANEAHLLSGKLYYNLHTVLHPNGEIRGQVDVEAQ